MLTWCLLESLSPDRHKATRRSKTESQRYVFSRRNPTSAIIIQLVDQLYKMAMNKTHIDKKQKTSCVYWNPNFEYRIVPLLTKMCIHRDKKKNQNLSSCFHVIQLRKGTRRADSIEMFQGFLKDMILNVIDCFFIHGTQAIKCAWVILFWNSQSIRNF